MMSVNPHHQFFSRDVVIRCANYWSNKRDFPVCFISASKCIIRYIDQTRFSCTVGMLSLDETIFLFNLFKRESEWHRRRVSMLIHRRFLARLGGFLRSRRNFWKADDKLGWLLTGLHLAITEFLLHRQLSPNNPGHSVRVISPSLRSLDFILEITRRMFLLTGSFFSTLTASMCRLVY